jgi:hypothetical protein
MLQNLGNRESDFKRLINKIIYLHQVAINVSPSQTFIFTKGLVVENGNMELGSGRSNREVKGLVPGLVPEANEAKF